MFARQLGPFVSFVSFCKALGEWLYPARKISPRHVEGTPPYLQAPDPTGSNGKIAWAAILAGKVPLIVISALVISFARFNTREFLSAYAQWPAGAQSPSLPSKLGAWDAAHYLILSERGYEAGSHSCAFYPLWPAEIRAASVLSFGRPLLAGMVLANILSIVALLMCYKLLAREYGDLVGRRSLVLLLAFPSAFFFSLAYTESLYLSLVVVFFWFLGRDRYFWPVVAAFLAPLTKAIGVFLVLPLAWHLYERRKPWKYWLLLLAPLAGYAAYFGLMHLNTGNAFEGFDAQKAYPYSPSIKNMFNFAGLSEAFLNVQSFDGMMDSLLDRALFVLLVLLLPLVWRLNRTWFFYTAAAGVVPALTSWFMSYRRYFLVCFPAFVILAQLSTKKPPWAFWYVCGAVSSLAGLGP